MREDTKDLVAVTILIFFAVLLTMLVLWVAAEFFLILIAIFGSIGLFTWALIRVSGLDK